MSDAAEEAEKLRDPSHVRNYSEAEWRGFLEQQGSIVEEVRTLRLPDRVRALARADGLRRRDAERVRELLADRIDRRPDRARPHRVRARKAVADGDPRRQGRRGSLVQGLTGSEGRFHGLRNRALRHGRRRRRHARQGRPGRRGHSGLRHGRRGGRADRREHVAVFVPARFAPDAFYEAIDAGHQDGDLHHRARARRTTCSALCRRCRLAASTMIGPNCPGALSPGKANVGIIPARDLRAGARRPRLPLGHADLPDRPRAAQLGLGNSTIVGIGGDPIVGSSFIDILELLRGRPRDRAGRARRRDRRRRGGAGRALRRRALLEARVCLHRRLLGAAGEDDGPRGRDHLRARSGTAQAQAGGARGGRDRRRHDADAAGRAQQARRSE